MSEKSTAYTGYLPGMPRELGVCGPGDDICARIRTATLTTNSHEHDHDHDGAEATELGIFVTGTEQDSWPVLNKIATKLNSILVDEIAALKLEWPGSERPAGVPRETGVEVMIHIRNDGFHLTFARHEASGPHGQINIQERAKRMKPTARRIAEKVAGVADDVIRSAEEAALRK
jgi:hypothetical protein